tara:strand:- start:3378 stop:3494 length:117 start_codon:yes stop_codon:yes gene_type:complete
MIKDFFTLGWQLIKDVTKDNIVWLSFLFIIVLSIVLAI